MKIKQDINRKKVLIAIALSAIAVIGLFGVYSILARNNTANPEKDSSDTSTSPTRLKEPESTDKLVPSNTDHGEPIDTNESAGKQIIPMVASSTVSGDTIFIRGGLNVLRTDGECYATLTGPNGEVIRKDTSLLPSASTTDCKTISLPTSELSPGKWTVNLIFTSDSAEGSANADSIVIQ